MARVFAVGDIHGCSRTFRKLVLEEIKIRKSDIIFCLGDYVDRGDDSKGVLDFIMDLRAKKYKINTIRGNHEQLMIDSVQSKEMLNLWKKNGGVQTLNSFNVKTYPDVPLQYRAFVEQTDFYLKNKHYILVHA